MTSVNPKYIDGLQECWQDERYGLELFTLASGMAEQKGQPEIAKKLAAIAALEKETLDSLNPLAVKYSLTYDEAEQVQRGKDEAARLMGGDWREMMEDYFTSAVADVERMQELLSITPEEDRNAIQFLVAHEVALRDFCEQEWKYNGKQSTDRVLELIDV